MSSGWHTTVSLSNPDEIRPRANLSRWLGVEMMLCHPNEIGQCRHKSSWWHSAIPISHPDEILQIAKSTYDVALSHPDEITNLIPKSSRWLSNRQYITRMTYGQCIMSSGWQTKSPGWNNVSWTLCHPDEIAPSRILSGWLMINAGCHPDD